MLKRQSIVNAARALVLPQVLALVVGYVGLYLAIASGLALVARAIMIYVILARSVCVYGVPVVVGRMPFLALLMSPPPVVHLARLAFPISQLIVR
jgi:hypothetical protein